MRESQYEMNIAKNIKSIEWVKTELLDSVAGLFRGFVKGSDSVMVDYLANVVVSSYVLARRLGIEYHELDRQVAEAVRRGKQSGHQVEQWYGDLSLLEEHIQKGR
jgi:hypothetical protein